MPTPRIPCVGAVVVHEGRLLLVRRGQAPGRGLWSVPGGRVEAGETRAAACEREVAEETGLRVRAGALVGSVERDAPTGGVYVIDDFDCTLEGPPDAVAGDDADEVLWVSRTDLDALLCVDGLLDALTEWRILDRLR